MAKAYDYLFKLLTVGDSGVGKTPLISQFTSDDDFNSVGIGVGRALDISVGKTISQKSTPAAGQQCSPAPPSSQQHVARVDPQGIAFSCRPLGSRSLTPLSFRHPCTWLLRRD